MAVRDVRELLAPAVEQAITALGDKLTDADGGTAQLARRYAATIDSSSGHCAGCEDPDCKRAPGNAWAMRWLAPLLLDALDALGASPAARARLKGKPADGKPNRLAALRDARGA